MSRRPRPSRGSICSTRPCSDTRRQKSKSWTRSTACSWSAPGKRWKTPATIRTDMREPLASSPAATSAPTFSNCRPTRGTFERYNTMQMGVAFNSCDSLTTKVSYKLNLRGPSMSVQTFCSTSAVAVHMACKSILNGECDMALAGGAGVVTPQKVGYVYSPGGIDSPDGHCRAFDANGRGAILGNGVAVVLLNAWRRLVRWRPHLRRHPRFGAQQRWVPKSRLYRAQRRHAGRSDRDALADARVEPDEISYVEAHGTGTELGDPIEMLALTKAFRADRSEAVLRGRIGQDQYRSSRSRCRRHQHHQDCAGAQPPPHSGEPALRAAQSEDRLREEPVLRQHASV